MQHERCAENGSQLLLSCVYDRIGFSRIKDEILRHLVIARVSQPASKLAARPIFHFTERRIEAHICICFIAYKVYREVL